MQNWLDFVTEVNTELKTPRILELGTRRANPSLVTSRKEHFKNYSEYIMSDYKEGLDVDVIADIHELTKTFGEESFDVIFACSVFEHLKYPQLGAHEIMKTLKINGLLFIQTHQTFPLHAYPSDYYRFSRKALEALFPKIMGFDAHNIWYEFRAVIHSKRDPNTQNGLAYLNSNLCGIKKEKTPEEFIYEFE